MKAVVAMDSFKGSMTSLQAGNAVKEGILKANPNAEVIVLSIADGGEGTVEALCTENNDAIAEIEVHGPLGNKVLCTYGIRNGSTAVIEIAKASGLTLVKTEELNVMKASSYGTGEVILNAIHRGIHHFIIGIGGSAMNDGGVGMLKALGYEFFDREGKEISLGAEGLKDLYKISDEDVVDELSDCSFEVACDVNNPLCGKNGCSAIYGSQKGASQKDIEKMDQWLHHFAQLTKTINPQADENQKGAGAAGGLGFAFSAYLHANLTHGISIIMKEIKLEDDIKDADYVITGEGKLDTQSMQGKTPVGIALLAKKYHVPVIVLTGSSQEETSDFADKGITAVFAITRGPISLESAMDTDVAISNTKNTAEQIFRLLSI